MGHAPAPWSAVESWLRQCEGRRMSPTQHPLYMRAESLSSLPSWRTTSHPVTILHPNRKHFIHAMLSVSTKAHWSCIIILTTRRTQISKNKRTCQPLTQAWIAFQNSLKVMKSKTQLKRIQLLHKPTLTCLRAIFHKNRDPSQYCEGQEN